MNNSFWNFSPSASPRALSSDSPATVGSTPKRGITPDIMKHSHHHSFWSLARPVLSSLCLAAVLSAVGTSEAAPKLVEIRRGPEGAVHLKLQAADAGRYTVQVSPDLTTWIPLYAQEALGGSAEFSDTRGTQFKALYYRAVTARADELANPLAVQAQPDPSVSASAILSPQGGSLALTNSDGTVIELTLPEGALESDTSIRMTLVRQITGWPFSGKLLAAVQLEPEGLELKAPGILGFRLATPPTLAELAGFGYRGLGQSFHLITDDTTEKIATIRISHFSGAGLGLGPDSDISNLNARPPEIALDRFEAAAAFIRILIRRQGGQPTSAQLDALEALHRQYYTSALDPALRLANTSTEFFNEASSAFLLWITRVEQAGLTNRLRGLLDDGQRLLSLAGAASLESRSGWRRLDVNKDGRVDAEDGKKIFAQGIWKPASDVNGDGKLDIQDFWAWVLFMSRWDRTADRAVSGDDFRPLPPMALPVANPKLRDEIVRAALNPAPPSLPAGYEENLLARMTNGPSSTNYAKSQMLLHGGASALMQHNLEVARWSFARACQIEPTNYPALANLAFTFTADGRFQEGLQLVAETLALQPACATAWNNLGMIYLQNGQSAEAQKSFDRAIQNAPFVGQYQLNKAIALLQSGANGAAVAAAASAARLGKGDPEAQVFNLAIHPPNPGNLAALESEYENYRKDVAKNPLNPLPPSWSQLTFREQAKAILELPDYQYGNKLEEDLNALRDDTMQKVREEFDQIRPKWVAAKDDMTTFFKHFPSTVEKLVALNEQAQIQATYAARAAQRKIAGAQLAMDQVVLQLALAQGQIDMLGYADANEAREAFVLDIDEIYEDPMRDAARILRNPTSQARVSLPTPEYTDMLQWSGGLGFFNITLAGAVDPEGYGKGFVAPTKQFNPVSLTSPEGSVGLSLPGGVVQAEYNFNTGETKLQVGQGLVVASTWHPKNGYGFQIGLGFDFELPLGAEVSVGTYLKFGSDGSISSSIEEGVGVKIGPAGAKVTGAIETVIVAATHAPLMSIHDLY